MEFFHVYNRGVDKRKVFLDDKDHVRFIHDMFVFNSTSDVDPNNGKRFSAGAYFTNQKRDPLVDVHAYCLMPNHYHMLVTERVDGGLSKFMKKLNQGYAQYFNEKYDRSGVLWQGTYKKKMIKTDGHFLYIPLYIHLNPLDLNTKAWRTGTVTDPQLALKKLEKYRWSSHLDYVGVKNFPSVITKKHIDALLGSRKQYEQELRHVMTRSILAHQSNDLEYR